MTTYQLTQDVCEHNVPPTKTVTAECIHRDDDFIRFHDADHQLVYAVQRGLLLAIETVENEDQADEPAPYQNSSAGDALTSPAPTITIPVDGAQLTETVLRRQRRTGVTTPNRWLLMRQFGWSLEQANELPDWLVSWLHDQH